MLSLCIESCITVSITTTTYKLLDRDARGKKNKEKKRLQEAYWTGVQDAQKVALTG